MAGGGGGAVSCCCPGDLLTHAHRHLALASSAKQLLGAAPVPGMALCMTSLPVQAECTRCAVRRSMPSNAGAPVHPAGDDLNMHLPPPEQAGMLPSLKHLKDMPRDMLMHRGSSLVKFLTSPPILTKGGMRGPLAQGGW